MAQLGEGVLNNRKQKPLVTPELRSAKAEVVGSKRGTRLYRQEERVEKTLSGGGTRLNEKVVICRGTCLRKTLKKLRGKGVGEWKGR